MPSVVGGSRPGSPGPATLCSTTVTSTATCFLHRAEAHELLGVVEEHVVLRTAGKAVRAAAGRPADGGPAGHWGPSVDLWGGAQEVWGAAW